MNKDRQLTEAEEANVIEGVEAWIPVSEAEYLGQAQPAVCLMGSCPSGPVSLSGALLGPPGTNISVQEACWVEQGSCLCSRIPAPTLRASV